MLKFRKSLRGGVALRKRATVEIYTDGACSGNPGPGGWGVILMHRGREREISGSDEYSTNQRMELQAAIEGLKALRFPCRVKLYSDSAYLVNAFQEKWIDRWQRNGWLNYRKEPIENQDLWKQLLELAQKHQVEWIKVEGHTDNPYNNRCDQLAREAIRKRQGL
ncbi:MAG: ribonuclease HI [Syntrophomonadaceae bacterium]|nr:ribonuclease HI [Syntrophomonadaceae bacterium]